MRNTLTYSTHVTALFSAIRADGTTTPLDIATVGVHSKYTASQLVDVHRALTSYLVATDAPAGIYQFQVGDETRMDRWDGTSFPGCNCRGGVDLECGMYACRGIPAARASKSAA